MVGARGILGYFVRHRTAANLLLVLLMVSGLMAMPNMRAQFLPDVVVNTVSVSVAWDGAGPSDVDSGIVQLLEPALQAVEGVSESSARSTEGRASLTLEFEPGWNMARATDDVQAAVDAVTTLPEGADDANIRQNTWRDRVTDVVITGPIGVDQLARLADEFVARLYAAGITRTTIRGLTAPTTTVEVPGAKLLEHDLTLAEIATAIRGEADVSPAGDVSGANARVRTGTEKRAADQIAGIALRSDDGGGKLLIGDIARIRVEGAASQRAYFVGDDPAISIRVDRSETGDAIGIQRTVEKIAADMRVTLPDGVRLDLIRTRAEAITSRLNLLLDNGLVGLGLVVMLLFLFLNARTAFWVAAGIPVAMLATIAIMYLSGLTINMISLFALIITLGIVVDDAIVVGEHADFRARRLGEGAVEAAENAALRMTSPVFSATITTVIAFFGLTAIGGWYGRLISDLPYTVIAVLLASLVECFLILPNHMAHALTHVGRGHWYDWPNRQVNKGFSWLRDGPFRTFLKWVIIGRYAVLAGALVLLASQAATFIRGDLQWRFFNAPERSSVTGNFAMAPGTGRSDSLEMLREFQRATDVVADRYVQEYGQSPLNYVLAEVGGNAGRGLSGTDRKDPDQLGGISIELIDADLRPYTAFEFVADLKSEVQTHPLAEVVSFRRWHTGRGGGSLEVAFYGSDVATLKTAAEALKTRLAPISEISALEDNLSYDKDEVILELTPQGQALGFDIDGLGRVLRDRLGGIEAATYPDGPRTAEIRVELPAAEQTADFLERSRMRTPAGTYVPLADIVSVQTLSGFAAINRKNGIAIVEVSADLSQDDAERANEIETLIEETILPDIQSEYGVEWTLSGQSEEEDRFLSDATFGFLMCLIGIYLTLAWVFSSWTRPMIVLAIIPFGLIGAIWGHNYWGVPLSMFSVVGLIGMSGIIINDSIVLVTTVDEYSRRRPLISAIIDGTADRLRPVLLTTLTTVFGLAPLLAEGSVQAEFLKPTVITLVFGLGFGFVLVLVIVPSLLAMQQDAQRMIQAAKRSVGLTLWRRARPVSHLIVAVMLLLIALFGVTMVPAVLYGNLPAFWSGVVPAALLHGQTLVDMRGV